MNGMVYLGVPSEFVEVSVVEWILGSTLVVILGAFVCEGGW